MTDLREYGFGDWFRICMKFIPAVIIAELIWGAILAAVPLLIIYMLRS